jgi:hypothetical protein
MGQVWVSCAVIVQGALIEFRPTCCKQLRHFYIRTFFESLGRANLRSNYCGLLEKGAHSLMKRGSTLEKFGFSLALCGVALVFSGTKACQEDYELGTQSTASRTTTPAATATSNDDDGMITRTPAASPTVGATATLVATPTVGATPTPTATRSTGGVAQGPGAGREILQELSALGKQSAEESAAAVSGGQKSAANRGDWLGRSFGKKEGADQDGWQDGDLDGFSDAIESKWSSDPADPSSTPLNLLSTSLDGRLGRDDSDFDGLSNSEEKKRGTLANSIDSDGDGRPDGAEVTSGSDPLDPSATYLDSDGDGLSDQYEKSTGLKGNEIDSDGDGLRDDVELVVGSNPLAVDSDGDGVADGREYDLGSDPTLADGGR